MPNVSVVVPIRERPELLRRALRSILGQRYPGHVECVVFDQMAPEIPSMRPSEDRTLRAVTNDRTLGLTGARNAGILASEGEVVVFCDDYDKWLPDKLRLHAEALRAGPAAVVSCGIYINYNGRTIRRVPPITLVTLAQLYLSRTMEVNPCTILGRRAVLLDGIGLVDKSIPGSYAEDHEWRPRAARLGPGGVVPRPLVRLRWHDSSGFEGGWRNAGLEYPLRKHPDLRQDPRGLAPILGQIALARGRGI